jgi:hypothetical protein
VCQKADLFVLDLSRDTINLPKKSFLVTGNRKLQEVLERTKHLLSFQCYLSTVNRKKTSMYMREDVDKIIQFGSFRVDNTDGCD